MPDIFHPEIVMILHNQHTCSYRVLKRNASIIYELDVPGNPGISLTFSEEDLTRFDVYAFLDLSSSTADPSQEPVLPTPP